MSSIEETNKIRASIGLKPLPVPNATGGPSFKSSKDGDASSSDSSSDEEDEPGSTLESRQAQGYDNWKLHEDERLAKAKREAKAEAIKKAHDAALKQKKLDGRGLGEADDDNEQDTRAWLLASKKRQKKIERERARKMEEELRERENAASYGAEDLKGVKVAHEVDDFEGGQDQVLVLKDATIDENEEEGDELENLDLKEQENLNERLHLKKKTPVYNPNDIDETGDRTILKHYDETIDGKKRKRFTLDAKGSTAEEKQALKQTIGAKLRAQAISLDILKDVPVSDYVDASEIKFRKSKSKKPKSKRQKVADEDDIFPEVEQQMAGEDAMDVDALPGRAIAPTRQRSENFSFVDDEDMQAMLAKQRQEAFKKRNQMKLEDIARQIREDKDEEQNAEDGNADEQEGGLIIDETSLWLSSLDHRPTEEKTVRRPNQPLIAKSLPKTRSHSPDSVGNVDMERSYADLPDAEDSTVHVKREDSSTPLPDQQLPTTTGLPAEPDLSGVGLGATLSLLTQRGDIKHDTSSNLTDALRSRSGFLAEKHTLAFNAEADARAQRESERRTGKLDRMSAQEREEIARRNNKQRDLATTRKMEDVFAKEYKPNVQLRYTDEFGRAMTQKEAFKELSHQFHGKGSGKQKTEKRLKKIEEEKKRESRSVF
ncbi:hypothetical protein MMC25_005307 [Agyrium rufum]|nr:hypothetical protein [Agyrium rufum]